MTNGTLMKMLVDHAKEYTSEAVESIKRNRYMNDLGDVVIEQDTIDAVLVDFVNFIAYKHGMDLGLYTRDLRLG